MPPRDRGLLARLDALVALVANCHGLALLPDGRLAAAETPGRRAGDRPRRLNRWTRADRGRTGRVELLRARGDRLEATSLRHAWTQIDEGLRAGQTFALDASK